MCFCNLHAHSHYSLLDGFGSPEAIILRSKELGYPAAALTDHGVCYGLVEFFKAGKKHGVKPLLGCELYVANRSLHDKEARVDVKPYHLTILSKNEEGYKNLLKMTTIAHLEGFYYKPRVDYELLRKHAKGLIALSGCVSAHLPRSILAENEEEVHRVIKMYIEIFGKENYFLEIQDHPLFENQILVNERLKKLAKEYDLELVATNDSHYPRPEDREAHDVLLCIQTGSTVNDTNRMRYTGDFSIRAIDDLRNSFKDTPQALENTLKVADMCNIDFDFETNLIPSFDTPKGMDAKQFLLECCRRGLDKRFKGKEVPPEYFARLSFELETVNKMGFDTYFLIVADFVQYARDKNIVVGPGRGSAAGSIIAWSLGITDVDPIGYGLFFERFLNPERISMPDIDIDFADTRRDEVIDYVVQKYGRQNVAQILTFGTMAPRAAVRDVGRALGYPYAEVDTLAKTIPMPVLGKNARLEESIVDDHELSKIYQKDPRAKVLLDYAKQLEGTVRHVGTHACAVVISEKPLTEYTALQHGASGGGEIVTQFSAGPLEDLGLLKMDFLGLRNLSVIEMTEEIVERMKGEKIDIASIPMDDPKTFELLQAGDTTGVFQLESGGMKRYLKDLKPTDFNDIVAMGALYRPGPMEWIPSYIKGKHNPESVKYLDESFKSILESTYGVAVYQEQILQLARDFAGFSLGEADLLRKAVGKKIPELLAKQREKFIQGAVASGHKEKFAKEVFEKVVEPFAGYGFNKAHAVCYGLIAYQTAYLKANYPIEYMTSLLCSNQGNTEKVVLGIKECSEMGIDVLPPSINESFDKFTVINEKAIRFGLLAIKGLGDGPISEIVDARKAGPFVSLSDLAKRLPAKTLNKKSIQALAYSGALDEFGDRRQIAENYSEIARFAKSIKDLESNGQESLFGGLDSDDSHVNDLLLVDVPKATPMENLKYEKIFLGMYVSGHPLRGLKRYISKKANSIGNLTKKHLEKPVKVVGIISDFRRLMTKSGTYLCTFTLEDLGARVSAIMFTKAFAQFGNLLADDVVISCSGRLDDRRGNYQLICDAAKVLSVETMILNAKESGEFEENDKSGIFVPLLDDLLEEEDVVDSYEIKIPSDISPDVMKTLKDLLMRNKGATPVELFISSAKKHIKLPFGVEVNDSLKKEIDSLLTKA